LSPACGAKRIVFVGRSSVALVDADLNVSEVKHNISDFIKTSLIDDRLLEIIHESPVEGRMRTLYDLCRSQVPQVILNE